MPGTCVCECGGSITGRGDDKSGVRPRYAAEHRHGFKIFEGGRLEEGTALRPVAVKRDPQISQTQGATKPLALEDRGACTAGEGSYHWQPVAVPEQALSQVIDPELSVVILA